MDAPTTVKKKDNKHRPPLSTVLSMVNVVFFFIMITTVTL